MIHVITVHFKSPKWIDIQLDYLRQHLHEPYRVIANLEGVPGHHADKFDLVVEANGQHAGKLNLMAQTVAHSADPDDLLMFLDGDAFPVADPMPLVRQALASTALVAVRRDENNGDRQPHPCFAVLRVRDWERLHGDWSAGYTWPDAEGKPVTDPGGNLLATLTRLGESWTPLLRSNRVNPDPVWFGVYADTIYHHGAGFRPPMSRALYVDQPTGWTAGERIPVVGTAVRRLTAARQRRWRDRRIAEQQAQLDLVFEQLRTDPMFFRQFL